MNDNDRALCGATAGLLQAAGSLATWSLSLSVVAGLVLALTGRSLPSATWAAFAAVALIGLPERYLALRIRLEAALLDRLAAGTIASQAAMNNALAVLGQSPAKVTPTLNHRVLGARQLMQRHGLLAIAQTLLFAMALAMQDWG